LKGPGDGFVGDMAGKNPGYAVFDHGNELPMEHDMPEWAFCMSGFPFDRLLRQAEHGFPAIVPTTGFTGGLADGQHENQGTEIKKPLISRLFS
jgi:hypothetical protein